MGQQGYGVRTIVGFCRGCKRVHGVMVPPDASNLEAVQNHEVCEFCGGVVSWFPHGLPEKLKVRLSEDRCYRVRLKRGDE